MILIGDVHGLFYNYREILKSYGKDSLQLGDFGFGFPDTRRHVLVEDIPGIHKFLRGNHDNPELCKLDSSYIGDYGELEGEYIGGKYNKLFYISGAWSIDESMRIPGVTWWEGEQLSYKELCEASNRYIEGDCEIVCSHDCPTFVLEHLYPSRVIPTRTSQSMDSMFIGRKPKVWFFCHHHQSWRKEIDGCWFICLNELEVLDLSKEVIYNLN